MVLNCYVSPGDTSIVLYLSSSNPINQPTGSSWGYSPLTGALVTLSHDDESIPLFFDQFDGTYKASVEEDFFISGHSYVIQADHPDFTAVSATTTIPTNSATAENITVDLVEQSGFFETDTFLRFQLDLVDSETSVFNYYRLAFYDSFEVEGVPEISNFRGEGSYDDGRMDNGRTSIRELFFYGFMGTEWDEMVHEVVVITSDESYYRFHKTMAMSGESGGPFSEPVIVFSNVTNGLGCFGSYLKNTYIVNH